uniref:Uncharacterized protein n=1 Tax=Brassica oleracea TaxID=3712 RepID=A0A3P6F342_BRAOL|nr:unnamed protein product [Brassica oleracea]
MCVNRLPEAFIMGNNNSIAFSFINHFCRASNRKKRNLEIAVKKSKTVDSKV